MADITMTMIADITAAAEAAFSSLTPPEAAEAEAIALVATVAVDSAQANKHSKFRIRKALVL